MALHNFVFVIDVDGEDRASAAGSHPVKRGVLRILLHVGLKYGLDKVRWGYKFFQSKSGRHASLSSRGSDFKELRGKTFDDFGVEFEAKLDAVPGRCSSSSSLTRQPGPSTSVQTALKEALLDFQWDRPDITSPAKPSLRPRRSGRGGGAEVGVPPREEDDAAGGGRNVLFVVSRCPPSTEQFGEVMPKGLRDLLVQKNVTMHWIDSSSHLKALSCEDQLGADKLSKVLKQVGGRVISMDALLNLCCPHPATSRESFPLESSIGYLLSSERLYRLAFPVVAGALHWGQGKAVQSFGILMEPVSNSQRILPEQTDVTLTAVIQGSEISSLIQGSSDFWVLQCTSSGKQTAFQNLLMQLSARGLHMLADVNDGGLVCSAVLSPLSACTALLSVPQPGITRDSQICSDVIAPATESISSDLPDVVSSVLGVVYNIMDEDGDCGDAALKQPQVPDWARQELGHRSSPQTAGLTESWFSQSDQSGVSSYLMESMRLLHAASEQTEEEAQGEELSDLQNELIDGLAELYQTSQGLNDKRSKKRGAQRTPVKQKMKSMSRSLQMLNVARLNAKAQKSQADAEPTGGEPRGADRQSKRRSSDKSGRANSLNFTCEAELLTHLMSSYEKTVGERDSSLFTAVELLFSAIRAFFSTKPDLEVKTSVFLHQHLFKSSKSIRQFYGSAPNVESKVRECQLQAVLRLELLKLLPSEQSDSVDAEQIVEEVADMLRIISLTKDPVSMTRFLQDCILPGFLTSIPRTLADVYHSLGNQLPEALAAVLPLDFFSDESVARDSMSPSVSSLPPSIAHSLASDGRERLEDLRNRSANKKRSGMLTRHRSMTESSQSLRQITMPKKAKQKCSVASAKSAAELPHQKQATQEVTKVRRNLFNQEMVSPSKKAKLPRSQSVSAVEGLKCKRSHDLEERHKLLTKKVAETPRHKQVSSRLLYRQRMGRRSAPVEECIVEESPVKPAEDLRRSPRIKKLARRHSNIFYSSSQPRSRNLDRAISASQLLLGDGQTGEAKLTNVRSPMRLLFGAAQSSAHPSTSSESRLTRASRRRRSTDADVFESPMKTPTKSPGKLGQFAHGNRTPRTPQTPRTPKTTHPLSIAESPRAGGSHQDGMVLRGSPFRSPIERTLVLDTPEKQTPLKSPLKGILRTPVKALHKNLSPTGSLLLMSPSCRTPKKSVTWSPSPRKPIATGKDVTFKVPESPHTSVRSSPRLLRTPNKFGSPLQSPVSQVAHFKTPDKLWRRAQGSQAGPTSPHEKIARSEISKHENNQRQRSSERLCNMINTPVKGVENEVRPLANPLQLTPPPDQLSPFKANTRTPAKNPGPTHQLNTCSRRTPVKDSSMFSTSKPVLTAVCAVSQTLSTSQESPRTPLMRTRSAQRGQSETRPSFRSQASLMLLSNPNPTSSCTVTGDSAVEESTTPKTQEQKPHPVSPRRSASGSRTQSQQLDSSQNSSATTEDESMDIVDAAIVKTKLSGGLKMNIQFSRKPPKSGGVFQFTGASPEPPPPHQVATPTQSYGFRQTPDRQQREAAARLGYSNEPPRFSTPRGTATQSRCKGLATPVTYKVELEMQTSGLHKLRFRRTDSLNAGDLATDGGLGSGAHSPIVGAKPSQSDSPLALCSKRRDPSCVSPSLCTHVTPAKSTPGKGGTVQTYICKSYTPTRHTAETMSPIQVADLAPPASSPQNAARATPDNLNSWPRRKRAQAAVVGGKDRGLKGEPLHAELLEEAELGVSRLQDTEDTDYHSGNQAVTSERLSSIETDASLSPLVDMDWLESLAHQADEADPKKCGDDLTWATGEDVKSTATPPSSKVRKPVTASGILALTQSPMLFKGKSNSAPKRMKCFKDEAAAERTTVELERPPFSQAPHRPVTGRTCSRKRLLS